MSKKNFYLVIFSLVLCNLSYAQKFGHVNSAMLVEKHPGVAKANTELEKFRIETAAPFEAKAKAFQSKYQFFVEEMQAGTLSQVTAQKRQQELQAEQEALGTEEQQLQFAIMQRREQLLQPILSELDSLIQVIGKEGGYTMIFDNSQNGILLYSPQGEDLTTQVQGRIKQD